MLPRKINYIGMPSFSNQIGEQSESFEKYPHQSSYFREDDWAINKEDGGLILISEQKKSNQTKILKFVLKKFI